MTAAALPRGGMGWETPGVRGVVDEVVRFAEAAPVAGLSTTTTAPVSQDWSATRLVAPKVAH